MSENQQSKNEQTIRDRLYVFVNTLGIPMREFAKKCGIYETTIYSSERFMGNDLLQRIYKAYPELNPTWLQLGTGAMLRVIKTKDMEIIARLDKENMRLTEQIALMEGQITRLLIMLEERDKIISKLIEKM